MGAPAGRAHRHTRQQARHTRQQARHTRQQARAPSPHHTSAFLASYLSAPASTSGAMYSMVPTAAGGGGGMEVAGAQRCQVSKACAPRVRGVGLAVRPASGAPRGPAPPCPLTSLGDAVELMLGVAPIADLQEEGRGGRSGREVGRWARMGAAPHARAAEGRPHRTAPHTRGTPAACRQPPTLSSGQSPCRPEGARSSSRFSSLRSRLATPCVGRL